MTTSTSTPLTVEVVDRGFVPDEAEVAAAAFLARYSGRILDAYRHDLRGFFAWAAQVGLAALEVTRPHIELYRCWLEEQGLAASTIDRRLSTVCGFYRFAHIDGRVASNPVQYVRRPQVHPSEGRGLDRSELGAFLLTAERYDHDHAALAVLLGPNGLRVSEACATDIEDLGNERGHRALRIVGKGNKPATIPLVPRGADRRSGCRGALLRTDPSPLRRAAPRPTDRAPLGPVDREASRYRPGAPSHAPSGVHHGLPRRRRPTTRRPACGTTRRSPHHHRLRPATTRLRPTRRLRRRCLRHRRIGLTLVRALLPLISPPRLTALPNALLKAAPMFVRIRPPRTWCPRT